MKTQWMSVKSSADGSVVDTWTRRKTHQCARKPRTVLPFVRLRSSAEIVVNGSLPTVLAKSLQASMEGFRAANKSPRAVAHVSLAEGAGAPGWRRVPGSPTDSSGWRRESA